MSGSAVVSGWHLFVCNILFFLEFKCICTRRLHCCVCASYLGIAVADWQTMLFHYEVSKSKLNCFQSFLNHMSGLRTRLSLVYHYHLQGINITFPCMHARIHVYRHSVYRRKPFRQHSCRKNFRIFTENAATEPAIIFPYHNGNIPYYLYIFRCRIFRKWTEMFPARMLPEYFPSIYGSVSNSVTVLLNTL